MKKTKTQKGITLIALIITVIILFILAVVAIRAVQDGGIIEKAKLATTRYKYAEAMEDVELIMADWYVQKYLGNSANIQEFLQSKFEAVETLEEGKYKVTHRGYEFIISVDENGEYTVTDLETPNSLWVYEVIGDEVTITGLNFTNTDIALKENSDYWASVTLNLTNDALIFPDYIEGKPVTVVMWDDALTNLNFTDNLAHKINITINGIRTIKYGNNIKAISSNRYTYDFKGVTEIELPDNLELIGNGLFKYYNNDLNIPASVTTMEEYALDGVITAYIEYGTKYTATDASNANNWGAINIFFENDEGEGGIAIGDKVAYNEGYSAAKRSTVDSAFVMDDLDWRVLDVAEDGTVKLISTQPTTSKLTLSGEDGYLYGPDKLDKLCSDLYANGTGVTARSLKVEDIDKLAGVLTEADKKSCYDNYGSWWRYKYDPTEESIQYSKSTDYNPETKTGTWTEYKNTGYATFKEPGKAEINSTNYQDANGKEIENEQKYTFYYYLIADKVTQTTSDGISMVSLISQGLNDDNNAASGYYVNHWLSSSNVSCTSNYANFSMRCVVSGYVNRDYLWNSRGDSDAPARTVRPVVSLPSDVFTTKVDGVWQVNL